MRQFLYLSIQELLSLHKKQIDKFGGLHGIRDHQLLCSALGQVELVLFGEPVYSDAHTIAAIYAYHLIKNHPFLDGNKRAGIFAALMFLRINEFEITATNDDLYNLAMNIAAGQIDNDEVISFFKEHIVEK